MSELKAGAILQGGKYKIEKSLGQGGFGITYLAEHELLGRKVCIKEFFMKEYGERTAAPAADDAATVIVDATVLTAVSAVTSGAAEIMGKYREKFIKEAKTIARLDHPGIVRIHDVFEENGTAYYVMDFIEGENLNDLVKREGALPEERALGYIRQVADALSYVHGQNIMHLDVKPSNIIVRKSDDRAMLIDFGTAKQYDSTGTQTSTTPVGLSAGYAPIELMKVGGVQTFSPETDVYSLGATLYYLVTGQNPPDASDVLEDGLPAMPGHLSESLRSAVSTAMNTRKNRPKSVAAFMEMLDETCQAEGKREEVHQEISQQTPSYFIYIETDPAKEVAAENKTTGFENGHEWVDLGLSVKWATCNIGANSPEEYGDYFAWGEVAPKRGFKYSNYKFYCPKVFTNYSKYNREDKKIQLDSTDDAATFNWGGRWRMPTRPEMEELSANTTLEVISNRGRNIFKITSKINGNSIILPASGYFNGKHKKHENQIAFLMTSDLFGPSIWDNLPYCQVFYIGKSQSALLREEGIPVRPVCP